MGSLEGGIKTIIGTNPDLGPVYMEASYPARRVYTRPGGTNKRSVYMEPSYSAFVAWLPLEAEMAPKQKKDLSHLKR
jgi:hypothetical protein